MPEISSTFVEQNIVAHEFNKIKIAEEDGTSRELNPRETKKFIMDLVFGGKKLSTLEKDLIEAGISGTYWGQRKQIIKLFEDRFADNLDDQGRESLREEFEKFEEKMENDK